MKALILNSGLGSRMGDATKNAPKCMSIIKDDITIISNQIKLLHECGINEIVITTGAHSDVLKNYLNDIYPNNNFKFIHNDLFRSTNYIYSIYLAKDFLQDDLIMMHGDLVFDYSVISDIVSSEESCVVVDSTLSLPEKDFKAVIDNSVVKKIGIDFFDDAYACQPLYKLNKEDWLHWLSAIIKFCENDNRNVYAENALNEITAHIMLRPYDIMGRLCMEVDTMDDLERMRTLF